MEYWSGGKDKERRFATADFDPFGGGPSPRLLMGRDQLVPLFSRRSEDRRSLYPCINGLDRV